MRLCRLLLLLNLVWAGAAFLSAQVVSPLELSEPKLRQLQQRHFKTLVDIGEQISRHKFPYPFYFSRVLDIDQQKQAQIDQRSIRFDSYKGQTVLEITGNYYVSYSAEKMDTAMRVRDTFNNVVVPMLQAAVPHFPDDSEFTGFAVEVSHHVRQKLMGVSSENAENVTAIVPMSAAQKLVDAKTDDQRQAALLDSQVFLNGQPVSLWISDGQPPQDRAAKNTPSTVAPAADAHVSPSSGGAEPTGSVAATLMKPAPQRIFTRESLALLQRHNQENIDRMVKAMQSEAHFVPYAPPTIIGFRQGAYLQLSLTTALKTPPDSSRYKQAALAFDEHIARLVRPLLSYFPEESDFDGVDFGSSIQLADGSKAVAVEFYFPFRAMRCFASYDCTGQQLIDAGTVVINGERAKLDLQVAEGNK